MLFRFPHLKRSVVSAFPKQMKGITKDSLMQVPGHSGRGSGFEVVVVVACVVVVVVGRCVVLLGGVVGRGGRGLGIDNLEGNQKE